MISVQRHELLNQEPWGGDIPITEVFLNKDLEEKLKRTPFGQI